ncbi:MAG TPA: flagellar hook-associated protein FlgL [Deltaproteobacteria bacterium]|jgi:flagellar hook-associated protein 3 FlgL|nr:flagellar hook-associated protein FlgL [Deltaproteobacteria bacterium]HQJ07719.1 flagellar hook-associated protein FlgL [Deltaproteobacteria bacterium]
MRVNNRFLYSQLVRELGMNTEKLFSLNSQITSGKRIQKPSDDPIGLSKVLINRTELNGINQFQRTIDLAKGWLSRMDSICIDVDDLLARASEIAVQQSSSTSTANTRASAAEEVRQLREMVLGHANSKYGNKYIFGGTDTQNLPFLNADVRGWQDDVSTMAADAAGAVANLGRPAAAGDRYINTTDGNIYEYDGSAWQVDAAASEGISAVVQDAGSELYVYNDGQWVTQYQGNDSTFSVKIGKTDTVKVNTPGIEIFRNSQGDIFMTLMKLERALRNNDQSGISAQLTDLENSSTVLSNNLAKVGAVINRLDHTASVLKLASVDIQESTSNIEDLDYAEAITSLQNQQIIYEAALKSASIITSMSLVNFVD